jgi:uncharacterized protein (DUF427 family)
MSRALQQPVKGRLVRPVHVLDHQGRRLLAALDEGQELAEELSPVSVACAELEQSSADGASDLVQGPKGRGVETAVVEPAEPLHLWMRLAEGVEQRGLTEARILCRSSRRP